MIGLDIGRWSPRRTAVLAAMIAPLAVITAGTIDAKAADCRSYAQKGADWSGCKKSMLIITGSELDHANLARGDFSFTDFRGSSLKSANIEKAKMIRASFAQTNLENANLDRVEAYRVNFSASIANGASFVNAEVQRADFRNAKLRNTDFTKAELGRADFGGADVTGSRFTMANLARARLTGALWSGPLDFQNAFLLLTRLDGADLSAATGLVQEQINLACGDGATRLPPGLTAPPHWPCADDPDDSTDPN